MKKKLFSIVGGDFINKFFKDIFNKGNFKDYFKRNKFFILISLAVIILSLWSGFTNHTAYANILTNVDLPQLANNNPLLMFEDSLISNAMVILAGFTFSILSILLTVIKGVSAGYLLAVQNTGQSFITYLPRGIFELFSQVFALVGAFLVTKIEVRLISIIINRKFDTAYSNIKAPLKDLVLTIVFIIIFLLISLIIGMVV